MANVSFDAKFMKQIVPSVPISHAQAFQVIRDGQSHPIIFSIGTGGSLFALLPDGTNGQTLLLHLGTLFGLSMSSIVSTMSVSQDEDLAIYLTFAVDGAKSGDPSTVYVVQPTKPADWLVAFNNSTLAPSLLKDVSVEKCLVKQLHIAGAADPTTGYPPVVVVYSGLDNSRIDAALLDINVSQKQWKYSNTFELPEMPENMVAMCAGALPAGINGLFCLYDSQGKRRLTFAGYKGGKYHEPYSTSLRPPPGAQSLATFVNQRGLTDLLMGGNAITHYTAFDAVHSDKPTDPDRFKHVTSDSDPYIKQLRQITIAQASSHNTLTIYGRNGDDTVVYQHCNITSPSPTTQKLEVDGPSIPLLTREQGGGHFTVLLDGATGSQKLFIVGQDDTLTRMEQSGGTRLWQRIIVLVPSAGENKEITSYTSHIHVSNQNGPITDTKFLLCSSSTIDLGSNGGSITVTPSGIPVTTDKSGNITLIQNVTGLSSVVFTLKDDAQTAQSILGKSHDLNPAMKVQRVLDSIQTPDDARNARLPNGNKLLDHASATPGDINMAVKALPLLSQALKQVPRNGGELTEMDVAALYSSTASTLSVSDWDFWEWVSNALGKVEDFFVDAWHLVVKFAGQVFRFFLKSLSYILKAVHWLLQDVFGIPIDKIIEWLGFLFQWDDILETHDIFSAMVNTGIDCAIAKVNDFATIVDGWFAKGDGMIKSLDSVPPNLRDKQAGRSYINSEFDAEEASAPVTKTTGSNWSSYQVKHGGIGKSLHAQNADSLKSNNPLLQFWEDVAGPALEQIRKTLEDAMKNIAALFHSNNKLSFGQLLQHLGVQLLRDVLGVIRTIVVGLIKFIADFTSDVKVQLNKSLDIPLLTPLYRWISKGHDLTMLDAIALLIAVPTTVVCKALTGKKPADIDGVKEFMEEYKKHHSRLVQSLLPFRATTSNVLLTSAKQHSAIRVYFASGLALDDLLAKLKKFATRIITYAMPFVNFILVLLAPLDWYTPLATTAAAGNKGWWWKMPFGIIACVGTYPYDNIPGHSDLHLCRQLAWGLGILSIPATPASVRVRGIMALATGCFQVVPEAVSIPMAISSAKDGTYGRNLDSSMVWADICDRLFALIGKGAGGVCMILNKPDPYSLFTALIASDTSIACQAVKAVAYHPQAKTGMPQATLYGLS